METFSCEEHMRLSAFCNYCKDNYNKEREIDKTLPPFGYTAEELDEDNPYNSWMYNDER